MRRLSQESDLHDHKELVSLGLKVRNRSYRHYNSRDDELTAFGDDITRSIKKEGVAAADIGLIYNGKSVAGHLETKLAPILANIGIELSVQTNRPFECQPNTLLVTTSHSYKGDNAEVVLIPFADQYTTQDGLSLRI